MPKRAAKFDFPSITLDGESLVPLYGQLYESLRSAVLTERLMPGARLPSSRALAARLGISRNTVLNTYEQLQAEGFVTGRVGSGTRVARALPATYLLELVRASLVHRHVSFRRLLQESSYPVRVAPIADSDGNPLYLFDAGDSTN